MKLLFDIGNSTVNWVIEENGQFVTTDSFLYDKNNFKSSLDENLLLSEQPENILLANVAGSEIEYHLNNWLKARWSGEIWQPVVTSKYKQLINSYYEPRQMGIDRWLAIVAAWEQYHSALCVVNCGTAMTIDNIDSSG